MEAVAHFADTLKMHEVDGAQPDQNDHSGVSLEIDHVQASESDPFCPTDGKDACGGESWPNAQGKDQSWKEFRGGEYCVKAGIIRGRRGKSSRRMTTEEKNHGREDLATTRWWRPMIVNGDFRGESTMATWQCGEIIMPVRCGSTSASTAARTSTRRAIRGVEKDPSISSSCGQFLQSESRARHDGSGQREKAKWQAYRGSVAALLRNSGDSWCSGKVWRDTGSER